MGVVAILLILLTGFGSGCSRGIEGTRNSDAPNPQEREEKMMTRRCPLVYHENERRFFCPNPSGASVLRDEDVVLGEGESWSPDGVYRLSVVLEKIDDGLEGIALIRTNISTGKEDVYAVGENETLVSALEDEAGWPIMDVSYDQERQAIIYSVYRRDDRMPFLGASGEAIPMARTFVENRRIQ